MIPVTQTKVHIENSKGEIVQRGNCYAACIASILEVPITEVPNVEVLFHIDNGYSDEVMLTFLNSKGWELCGDDMLKRFHPDDNTVVPKGFSFRGVSDEKGSKKEFIPEYYEYKDKYYLVSGKSPRGVSHVCIFQNGVLVHDPHPSKEGILTLDYFETLIKAR